MTDRPSIKHHTDPLSEVFGSLGIQEAIYERLEATAPGGVRYSGDIGPRIRFMLIVRGSAFLRFKSQRRITEEGARSQLWHEYLWGAAISRSGACTKRGP
jgi:hypothetical protein